MPENSGLSPDALASEKTVTPKSMELVVLPLAPSGKRSEWVENRFEGRVGVAQNLA